MGYILFTTKPDGTFLAFDFLPEPDGAGIPVVGEYLVFDEREHGVPDAQGFAAYRVRQVIHWHDGGIDTPLVRADPVEVDDPAAGFARLLAAFVDAGGTVDAAEKVATTGLESLLRDAPP